MAKMHGPHCYDGPQLVCGWPEMHRPQPVYLRPSGVESWPDYDYLDGIAKPQPRPLARRIAERRPAA